jgi:hypothetical protein
MTDGACGCISRQAGREGSASPTARAERKEEPPITVQVRLVEVKLPQPPNVRFFPLRLKPSDTLRELKIKLEDESGTPILEVDPIMHNSVPKDEDDMTLAECGIRDGDLVVVVHRMEARMEKLMVRTPGGTMHGIEIKASTTIREFKEQLLKIERFQGIMTMETPFFVAGVPCDADVDSKSFE